MKESVILPCFYKIIVLVSCPDVVAGELRVIIGSERQLVSTSTVGSANEGDARGGSTKLCSYSTVGRRTSTNIHHVDVDIVDRHGHYIAPEILCHLPYPVSQVRVDHIRGATLVHSICPIYSNGGRFLLGHLEPGN